MNKQPSMYHLTAGYPSGCLAGSNSWPRSQYSRESLLSPFPGILFVLAFALLALSFSPRFGSACKSIVIQKKEAAPVLLYTRSGTQQFSFEYTGIIHIKLVIEDTPGAGLSLSTDMDFAATPGR